MSGIILLLFLILVALLCITLCFFGYRHIRLLFTGIGLLFGGYYTYTLLVKYATLSQTTSILIAVLVGLLLGGLAYFIYNFGIFLTGAAFGICVAIMIMNLVGMPVDSTLPTIIIVVLALCAGFLTLAYRRVFIVLSTAFTGGVALTLYGGFTALNLNWILKEGTFAALSGQVTAFHETYHSTLTIVMAALIVAGIVVQFVTGKKKHKKA